MGWQDAPVVSQNAWEQAPLVDAKKPESRLGDDPLRTAALGGRAAFEGVAGLPALFADAIQGGPLKRAIFGENAGPSLSEQLKSTLDKISYSPETKGERLLTDTVQGATGALAAGGPLKAAIPVLTAGAASGAASGATREAGGGTILQLLAGLGGGLAVPATIGTAKAIGGKVGDIGATIAAGFGNKAATEKLAGDAIERVIGDSRNQVKQALVNPTTYVAGAKPTVAEAIAEAQMGKPNQFGGAIVKLQKDLTGAAGAEDILPTVAKQQRQALEAPLNTMAGGATRDLQDAAQEAAKKFRATNAGAQYEAIAPTQVKLDGDLAMLLDSPAGSKALEFARNIAKNDQAAKTVAGGTPIPFELTNAKGEVTGYTAQGLQYVKSALDAMESNKSLQDQLGIAGTGKVKIGDLRDQLVGWMNKSIPGWENARLNYSAQSEPLNRLQVAQALADKLKNEQGTLTASTFLNAKGRGEDALIKKATGAPREVNFAPADEAALQGITQHLARQEEVNRIANSVKGSNSGTLAAGEVPKIPNLLNRTAMITNYVLKHLGSGANEPVSREIATRMADPVKFAELLARPVNDPSRKIAEAILRASSATMAAQQ